MTHLEVELLGSALLSAANFGTIRTRSARSRSGARRLAPAADGHPSFMITLTVPGNLLYRQLVLRVVESSCKLVRGRARDSRASARRVRSRGRVCAVEAFNNIVIHGYRENSGEVHVEIEAAEDGITIRLLDTGNTFNPSDVAKPRLAELPESGMGMFIIHSFMDQVRYSPGQPPDKPNLLLLHKRLHQKASPSSADKESAK
jgi:serine/threonine-protein kinase RsbW